MAKGNVIKIDDRQLKKWANNTKLKRPSQAIAIMRETLNDQAFAVRTKAQKEIMPKMFNIRSQWVISSVLVDKAKKEKNPKKVFAEVGGKKRWGKNKRSDFYGLRDQEYGKVYKNAWIHTKHTRGGSWSGKVKKSFRREALNKTHDINESNYGRVIYMIRQLDKSGHKGFFRIKRNLRGIKKGIYKFGSRFSFNDGKKRRKLLQVVDLSHRTARTLPRPWLRTSVKKAVTQQTTLRFFKRNYERFTTERKK